MKEALGEETTQKGVKQKAGIMEGKLVLSESHNDNWKRGSRKYDQDFMSCQNEHKSETEVG